MEKIIEMLQAMQEDQKEFRNEMSQRLGEMDDRLSAMDVRISVMDDRIGTLNDRLVNVEKIVIRNGEKIGNNRDYVNKKLHFFEHRSMALEQRAIRLS